MLDRFLEYLVCPLTGEPLELVDPERDEQDRIISGELRCSGHSYFIKNGIPNLLTGITTEVEKTEEQFAFEHLEMGLDQNESQKQKEDVLLFFLKTGIDPRVYELRDLDISKTQSYEELGYEPDWSFLNDKIVVDAGAASGRFAKLVAPHCKELILVDLGSHLHEAYNSLSHLKHVHFVNANLLHLPLREEVADFIYSIGVLHHTPDPKQSFYNLSKTLKIGGAISIWVYPPEYWLGLIRGTIAKSIRRILLSLSFKNQIAVIESVLYPLGRLQMKIARNSMLKLILAPVFLINVPRHEGESEMKSTIVDYYLPQYINTYRTEEILNWMKENNLESRGLMFPTSAMGIKKHKV